jgi:AcrR family transcriptional regulator
MTESPLAARELRRDAALNRDRLLAAADRVFADQGLEAGVAEIAREAGVGMGTLYRRFPTKDALIEALVSDVLHAIIETATVALEQPGGSGLEYFLRESAGDQLRHRGCLPRLWNTEHDLVQAARGLIARLLQDAKVHGRARLDLTTTDLTVMMWSIRGILQTAGDLAPGACQRHLDLLVAGMRPDGDSLAHPPVEQSMIDRILTDPTRH